MRLRQHNKPLITPKHQWRRSTAKNTTITGSTQTTTNTRLIEIEAIKIKFRADRELGGDQDRSRAYQPSNADGAYSTYQQSAADVASGQRYGCPTSMELALVTTEYSQNGYNPNGNSQTATTQADTFRQLTTHLRCPRTRAAGYGSPRDMRSPAQGQSAYSAPPVLPLNSGRRATRLRKHGTNTVPATSYISI